MKEIKKIATKLTFLLLITFSTQCFAQIAGLEGKGSGGRGQSEYFHSNPDQRIMIRVNFAGGVSSPGVYHLPDTIDLLESITLAGGYVGNADLSNVLIKRKTDRGYKVLHYDLTKVMQDEKNPFPPLQDHDTVVIDVKSTMLMEKLALTATILGIVSTSLLIFVTVYNLQKNQNVPILSFSHPLSP